MSTGQDLLAFTINEQPDGTIVAQHHPCVPCLARVSRTRIIQAARSIVAEITVDFDAATHSLSALNAAAYRLIGTAVLSD